MYMCVRDHTTRVCGAAMEAAAGQASDVMLLADNKTRAYLVVRVGIGWPWG